ncbi:hypothetical protein PVAP13_6KG410350 [Panicum virgatum]|uniref:Uncharacterized protein n=1 Tax=Panicum virgatum TaxID=38727 RepID=A0A8T0RI87_PANVG|nr:hypothetical protein PVAP13_6KG410350 [Panicum virgatum]
MPDAGRGFVVLTCCGRSASVRTRQPPTASVPCARPSAADCRSFLSLSPGGTPLSLLPSHSSPAPPSDPRRPLHPAAGGGFDRRHRGGGSGPLRSPAPSSAEVPAPFPLLLHPGRRRPPPWWIPATPSKAPLLSTPAGLRHGGSRPPPPGLGEGASRGVGDEAWRHGGGATGPQPGYTGRDGGSARERRQTAAEGRLWRRVLGRRERDFGAAAVAAALRRSGGVCGGGRGRRG